MKLKIIDQQGKEKSQAELPRQFSEPVRADLIKKAVLTVQKNNMQAYGASERAGMRHSADLSRRRRKYRGSYGHGISRVPRKILSRRGTQMYWVGAVMPGTVGGRKAHPPKPGKKLAQKINKKERRKAICSAISASINKELVSAKGHLVPDNYPFLITADFEKIDKLKDLLRAIKNLGFEKELERAAKPRKRAGRGKTRGRKKKNPRSLLMVCSDNCKLSIAASNLPGVEVANVKNLNSELLAPGAMPGRVALYTASAIEVLKKGLFTSEYKPEKQEKEETGKTKNMKK